MIRRTHPSPERSFEHREDYGMQASIGTLLQSIEDLRAELSQSQARFKTEQTRSAIVSHKLAQSRRQTELLRTALAEAAKPIRRRRKMANPNQTTLF